MSELQATQPEPNNMASVHAANVQGEHQPVDEPLPENEELEAVSSPVDNAAKS